MDRDIFSQLQAWKKNPKRKPLLLMGARQVGKTTLLKKFASTEYEHSVYLNFEEMPSLKLLFESSIEPEVLIKAIEIEMHTDIRAGKTLLILDEIQECPEALNSLKYFQESGLEYHICGVGSLLGVKLAHTKGFPVGKVNFLSLYPLNFFEFLAVLGEDKLLAYLNGIKNITPIPENLHKKLMDYFKIYLFVGGMPEAVAEYVDSKDFDKVRKIHVEILKAYNFDFAKHAPKEDIMKISLIWNAVPSQLAKENKKFIYSVIRKGSRAKDFESALQWLQEAGLIHKVSNITVPKIPLEAYAAFDFFKIYLLDVGLLGAMVSLSPRAIIHGDQLFQEFKGSLVENYVVQELASRYEKLYYWTSEGNAEVDLVLQQDCHIIPIEIKSGSSQKAKSLRVYADKYKPPLLVRTSPMNLKKDGDVFNCPLYWIGQLAHFLTFLQP